MNTNSDLDVQTVEGNLAHVASNEVRHGMCEDAPCCGCCGDDEPVDHGSESELHEDDQPSHGWPGDGSGEDDLADFNANEADDYRDEGNDVTEDAVCDCEPEFFGGE